MVHGEISDVSERKALAGRIERGTVGALGGHCPSCLQDPGTCGTSHLCPGWAQSPVSDFIRSQRTEPSILPQT